MDEIAEAKNKALLYLSDMDRTEQELRKKLLRSGFSEEAADAAIEYVRSYGYINDQRYVRHYLDISMKKHSLRRIRYDLEQKGIRGADVDAALEELDSRDERPLIRQLAEKKLRSLGDSEDAAAKYRKTAAHLARKGFSGADIHSVLSSMEIGGNADSDDGG